MDLLLAFLTFCVVNLSKASSNKLGSEDIEEGVAVGGRAARVPLPPPPEDGGGLAIGGVIVDLWRLGLMSSAPKRLFPQPKSTVDGQVN
jgi:hypothetical protein